MGLDKPTTKTAGGTLGAWWIPAVLLVTSVVFALGGDDARLLLRYDRVWLAEGQTWRFITGHLSHLAWRHLLLNAAGLVLVWFLVGARYSARQWLWIIGISLMVMNVGFWVLSPALHWYVGLSGLLHGLIVAGVAANWPKIDIESGLLGGLLIVKLVWEQVVGAMPGSEVSSGGPVVVDAHLYGALGGLLGAVVCRIRVGANSSI